MRKICYSVYTKIIVGILFVVSLLGAVTVGLEGVKAWDDYEKEVYLFEDYFEDSWFLASELNAASYGIYNTAVQYVLDDSFQAKENLDRQLDSSKMDYILSVDGKSFSNSKEQKQDYKYFYHIEIGEDGIAEKMNPRRGSFFVETPEVKGHEVEIYVGLKDSYAVECENLWNEQRTLVNGAIKNFTYWILAALAALIYLVVVIGRDEEGNKKSRPVDKMFVELNVAMIGGITIGCCLVFVAVVNQYSHGDFPYELLTLYTQLAVGITAATVLILLLSLIRNIKNGTFFSRFFILVVLSKCIKLIKKCIRLICNLVSDRMSLVAFVILCIYTALIGFFGLLTWSGGPVCMILGLFLLGLLAYFVIKYLRSLDEIKKGVAKIKDGELDYEMKNLPFKDLNHLKDGIQDMSEGLQASVDKMLKAERMKTELITNVSHDLKTPLTSIISYTKLLSDMENLPEEAKDYVAIIDKKSQRLKNLTQDLFDISKVQSGNDEIIMEKLNVETLLTQSLAEYEKELENMAVCTKIEEELWIRSDGRKMSRVINNLLDNVIKYSLPNTRVYINAYEKEKKVYIEIKNISSYALDFDKEEIMQRFKRGDESRSEEGHGLGLAIAKSYVEVTGGKFDIILDGDLFKVVLEYKQI